MQKANRFLYLLALIKFLLPLFLQRGFYQPHRDEFLYLAEGRHMAWGYLEVPPLLSVFSWLTNHLGGGLFWIKLWPNLASVCVLLLAGKIILSLGGKRFALLLGCLPIMIGGYLRLFYLLQPNFLDVLFWTLLFFSIVRYIQFPQTKWLYVFGVAAGLGMLSKYSVAFCMISILAALLLTPQRRIFLNKHLYGAALLAGLIFLPNALWQYNHNFPIVNHMQELHDQQLHYNGPLDFIKGQLLMNLPFLPIWLSGLFFVFFHPGGKPYRFVGWSWFFIVIILTVLQGKDYYAAGAYPVLFALGAFFLEQLTTRLIWVRYLLAGTAVALSLIALPLILPIAMPDQLAAYYRAIGLEGSGVLKWEDQQQHPLPQDFADMVGWREMTQQAARIYHSLPPEEQKQTMIYCRGYFTAGALSYYGKLYNLPEVHSDNASFLFWMPDTYNIRHLLFVGHNIPKKDDLVFQQFEKQTVVDSVNMPLFRETGTKFILYERGNDSVNGMIGRIIRTKKEKFSR
ncbi:MAG: glycosyltransferase family 39 protein [Williamsia sp.]|nr:glycosyltransferase family 39 protein [Williamsia sp.]